MKDKKIHYWVTHFIHTNIGVFLFTWWESTVFVSTGLHCSINVFYQSSCIRIVPLYSWLIWINWCMSVCLTDSVVNFVNWQVLRTGMRPINAIILWISLPIAYLQERQYLSSRFWNQHMWRCCPTRTNVQIRCWRYLWYRQELYCRRKCASAERLCLFRQIFWCCRNDSQQSFAGENWENVAALPVTDRGVLL